MHIKLDYGRDGITIDIPDNADVFLVRETPALPDEVVAIQSALCHPIGHPPLDELAQKGTRVVILHTDITRATPNRRLLPVMLAELERNGVRRKDITLLNALGTHRPQTDQEMIQLLGAEIAKNYRCLQHNAFDPDQLVSIGTSPLGHPIQLNRHLMDADLKILTGFIEPHFFAGFSGGPKAILPGVAGAASIFGNHSPLMIADPQADFNITEGNPIWEEMQDVALRVPGTFLLNVTLDRANRITGVYAGDVIRAHRAGCRAVRAGSTFPIAQPYDLVVTTNSGYPLDQNLYQCVKGLAAARRAVREGGAILLLAACEEGLPNGGAYAQWLRAAESPEDILRALSQPGFTPQDAWQVQIQVQLQTHADVYIYSDGLSDEQIKMALFQPCRDIPATIEKLMDEYGPRVCVLPQGPLTILEKETDHS